ncbi:hypothetical protein QJQ45_026282 [Haematococcus lacustris]|nr:hypothetical protein QJQ45_026282 [Haematococcus lacustris]
MASGPPTPFPPWPIPGAAAWAYMAGYPHGIGPPAGFLPTPASADQAGTAAPEPACPPAAPQGQPRTSCNGLHHTASLPSSSTTRVSEVCDGAAAQGS